MILGIDDGSFGLGLNAFAPKALVLAPNYRKNFLKPIFKFVNSFIGWNSTFNNNFN